MRNDRQPSHYSAETEANAVSAVETVAPLPERGGSEEAWNCATHSFGFLLSLVAAAWMFAALEPGLAPHRLLAVAIYAASLVLLYAASSLSHGAFSPLWKHRFRALDQGAIYLLIVGTYTPFIAAYLSGAARLACMLAMWVPALIGFFSKAVAQHRVDRPATIGYLLLGWLPSVPLQMFVPWSCLAWMALGGLIYTGGVYFLINDHRAPYYHSLWHISTMLASACHFYAVYQYVLA